jgi:hypothetical protein
MQPSYTYVYYVVSEKPTDTNAGIAAFRYPAHTSSHIDIYFRYTTEGIWLSRYEHPLYRFPAGMWVVGLCGSAVADSDRIRRIAQSSDWNVASYMHPLSALDNLLFAMGYDSGG